MDLVVSCRSVIESLSDMGCVLSWQQQSTYHYFNCAGYVLCSYENCACLYIYRVSMHSGYPRLH